MAYGGGESSVSVECCIRGYHVYQRMWIPELGEVAVAIRESGNHHNRYAVAILENGSHTYSKYRREHVLIVRLRASRMIHSNYAS